MTHFPESDLLIALYGGISDQPPWKSFLERLLRHTGAAAVSIVLKQGHLPMHEATEIAAGRNLRREARKLNLPFTYDRHSVHYEKLRPDRLYGLDDLGEFDPEFARMRERLLTGVGIRDVRIARIADQASCCAWLILSRADGPCTAQDDALLRALSPHLASALRTLVALEQARMRAAMGSRVLAGSGTGWIVFDGAARILDIEAGTADWFAANLGWTLSVGEKLQTGAAAVEKKIAAIARTFAAHPDAPAEGITLADMPRIDMALVPARDQPSVAPALPAMLGICRLPNRNSGYRREMIGTLFGLSAREAQLASLLSDGLKLQEAAAAMAITPHTARSYLKRIFAKTGARGQSGLVLILEKAVPPLPYSPHREGGGGAPPPPSQPT